MLDEYGDLLTVDDICEILMIGKTNAYALLRCGTLPAVRVGHAWRVAKPALVEFLLKKP